MNTSAPLQADRDELARFVRALFLHADDGGYVSLRSFYDDETRVFGIVAHQWTGDFDLLANAAAAQATRAARNNRPVVFAPPIATFDDAVSATQDDLRNGLALSVECDAHAVAARTKLELLLGPATMVVVSGGEWVDPESGEVQHRLHLHWRLTEPTRDTETHKRLNRARSLATDLVGSDASSKPAVHPMRWPGSWHRKGAPRLCRILAETNNEVDLDDAVERLQEAWKAGRPANDQPDDESAQVGQEDQKGESRSTPELVQAILTGSATTAPLQHWLCVI